MLQKFCKNCGAKLAPTDNFCTKCGTKIESQNLTKSSPKQTTSISVISKAYLKWLKSSFRHPGKTELDARPWFGFVSEALFSIIFAISATFLSLYTHDTSLLEWGTFFSTGLTLFLIILGNFLICYGLYSIFFYRKLSFLEYNNVAARYSSFYLILELFSFVLTLLFPTSVGFSYLGIPVLGLIIIIVAGILALRGQKAKLGPVSSKICFLVLLIDSYGLFWIIFTQITEINV